MNETLIKIFRFGVTGVSGMIVDFGATWLCKEKLKLNKYVSNSIGFALAVINNYIINRNWTFESRNPEWFPEFEKFFLFALIGLALNNLFLYLFHQRMKWNFYLAKLMATGLVFIWNFCTNYFFNFK